jgi:hypothetical protein
MKRFYFLLYSCAALTAATAQSTKADIRKYVQSQLLEDSLFLLRPVLADSAVQQFGLRQKPAADAVFRVVDIEKSIFAVLQAAGGQTFRVNFSNPGDQESELQHYFWPQVMRQKITAQYGEAAWNSVFHHALQKGFSKELCAWSWGEPAEKKTQRAPAGVTERWRYANGNEIVFRNGKADSFTGR